MTDLEALAARVEGAKGPDRELDALIASSLGWTDVRFNRAHGGYWEHDPNDGFEVLRSVPMWTASLDAAMSLVPEGYGFQVDGHENDWWSSLSEDEGFNARAATPALALTAAALRARAHQEQQS